MKECYVKIFGVVQGVFFRQSTKELADQLGVLGWVKNCNDGSVEATFIGNLKQIEQMLSWANQGSVNASVEKVVMISEKDCTKPPESFTILY